MAAAAVSLALASTGITGAGAQGSARGVTDDSIKVAGLTQGSNFTIPEVELGANARFKSAGKINGRTIELAEVADDKSDANTNLSEAKRLVQQEEVFAVAPVLTPVLSPQTATFFEQSKVPFFGWGIAQPWCENDYAFAFTGCIVPPSSVHTTGTTWGALIDKLFKARGEGGAKGKTAAVIAEDLNTGEAGAFVIGKQARKVGLKVTYEKNSLPATPPPADYTPFVQDIMTSNGGDAPDVVFVVTSFVNVVGVQKGLTQAGYEGVITNAVLYDPRLIASAAGSSVFTQFNLPEDTSNAKMQKIVADIKAEGGDDAQITQGVLTAYFSADLLVAAVKKAGKNLTPEAVAKVMKKFTYQVKGVIGPTKFPKAKTQGTPCGTLVETDGTAYEIVVPYGCYKNFNTKTGKFLKY